MAKQWEKSMEPAACVSKCNKNLEYLNYIDDLFAGRSCVVKEGKCESELNEMQKKQAQMKRAVRRKSSSKLKLKALSV